jgi:predicted ATPase
MRRWRAPRGQARPRAGDYFGPALATASRLEGAASGHQILISESTHRHFDVAPHDSITFTDLGSHRFKGVEPIQVFQVNAPGLPDSFGLIAGKRDAPEGNISANLSAFLGRTKELAELEELASKSRITTLLGPGGIGKTRLSIELARSLQDHFPDGAWMVDLSPVEPGFTLWSAFTAALAIPPVPDAEPRVQVLDRLRDAHALLLIDNCEHVVDDIAEAIAEIGLATTDVSFITTSRRVLGLPGEALYDVAPLDEVADDPARSPAVELFVERGQRANRRFQPTDDDLETVAAVCRDLDHLPLAIEIAAAHLRRMTLGQIQDKAANPLDFRSAKNRREFGRQHTLRETLEWSYALLHPASRAVLDHLSVFSGSFTEDVGAAVCITDDLGADDVQDAFDDLLDSSMLSRDPNDDLRFRILRTVRAFGHDRLEDEGRVAAAQRRHGEAYAALIAELAERFDSADEGEAAATIHAELPDLRAAFERAIGSDLQLAADLTAPLFFFNYVYRGAETGNWPARIMEMPRADELSEAPLLLAAAAGHALHASGQPETAQDYIDRAVGLQAEGASSSRGWVEGVAGQIAFWTGDLTASVERHLEAVEQARAHENHSCEVISLGLAAFSLIRSRDTPGADELLDQATIALERASQPSAIGYVHFSRGCVETRRNPKLARKELEQSLAWATMVGNEQGANRVRRVIADLRAAYSEPADALRIRADALLDFPERGDTIHAWSTIQSMIKPLAELGRDDDVAFLAGAVSASPLALDLSVQHVVDAARDRLGAADFDVRAGEGEALGLLQARCYVEESFVGTREGAG